MTSPRPCQSHQSALPGFGLSEAERGYVAGIIDGEGYISFRVMKAPGAEWKIGVQSCSRELILWLHEHLGGRVNTHKVKGRRRPAFDWALHGKRGAPLLAELLPLLVIKREQAALFIESYMLRAKPGSTTPLTSENEAARQVIHARFRVLNKRGTQ